MIDNQWIALYTKANQEMIALENLHRQAFEAYCPMITKLRRHARKTEEVRRPVFPSYVFVKFGRTKNHWRPLLSTRGVVSLVKFGEQISYLPARFIDHLRKSESDGTLCSLATPQIKPGDQVTLTNGPFQNLMARVLSFPEKDRIWVLLEMMGQHVRISQHISSLSPV